MSCEKYSGRITDAALGELPLALTAEFRAHVAQCNACRNAYRRAQEIAVLIDGTVSSLIESSPSPLYEVRLRARLDAEPAPSRWEWANWIPAAAIAIVLVLIATLCTIHFEQRSRPAPFVASVNAPRVLPPAENSTSAPRTAAAHASFSREPAVFVDKGELSATRQFAAALATGHVDGAALIAAQREIEKPLQDTPIKIDGLQIAPLDEPRGQ